MGARRYFNGHWYFRYGNLRWVSAWPCSLTPGEAGHRSWGKKVWLGW